jgi:metal-dependent hydrolase (beta-lactamase superfamily II)
MIINKEQIMQGLEALGVNPDSLSNVITDTHAHLVFSDGKTAIAQLDTSAEDLVVVTDIFYTETEEAEEMDEEIKEETNLIDSTTETKAEDTETSTVPGMVTEEDNSDVVVPGTEATTTDELKTTIVNMQATIEDMQLAIDALSTSKKSKKEAFKKAVEIDNSKNLYPYSFKIKYTDD